MRLSLQYRGARFTIYAIVLDNGQCPAVEFLEQVKQKAPASWKSLVHRYTRHADVGQSRNSEQSRAIKGRENLFEFKSRHGDRILWFYDSNRRTILTHGFHKGAQMEAEYDRAEGLRHTYLREVQHDDR